MRRIIPCWRRGRKRVCPIDAFRTVVAVHPEDDGDELARHRAHSRKSTLNHADLLLAGLKCPVPNSYVYT
jgi:hypothetical protein